MSQPMAIPPLFEHQIETLEKLRETPVLFDMSDPGTGKTRGALAAFVERRLRGGGCALVLAPKSILEPAWAADIRKFFPATTYALAFAHNRAKAFSIDADVYITNHDAVKWIAKNFKPRDYAKFDTLIVDESTAFKHRTSQRSKALLKIAKRFEYRELMTGTPNPNTILDIWHQVFLLDEGDRLGQSFFKFRSTVCEPIQVGPRPEMVQWKDRPGSEEAVFDLLSDISIRHRFEDCTDIPPNRTRTIEFDLPPKLRRIYEEMKRDQLALLESGNVAQAVHAGVAKQKLLQIASGALYVEEENYELVDNTRTELVLDLVEERRQSVVGFIWRHQRDALVAEAKKRGISYGVIDGSVTSPTRRTEVVNKFQAGELQVIFAHPQSAGHGLTLTKGQATIWASPTYNAEHYKQLFHRIYRTGQTEKTETIHVLARDTIDELVYERLDDKLSNMQLLLELMEAA